ncbi:MAG: hypothetical protein WCG27_03505 [Pseudomonadota bacterium]
MKTLTILRKIVIVLGLLSLIQAFSTEENIGKDNNHIFLYILTGASNKHVKVNQYEVGYRIADFQKQFPNTQI